MMKGVRYAGSQRSFVTGVTLCVRGVERPKQTPQLRWKYLEDITLIPLPQQTEPQSSTHQFTHLASRTC